MKYSLRAEQAEAALAERDKWQTEPPTDCGYHLAAWVNDDMPMVSELWFNDANGWWTSRGYLNEGRDRGIPIAVLAWMPMPRYCAHTEE